MDFEKKTSHKKFLTEIFSNDKYKKIIIIAGFTGVALIFISGIIKPNEKNVNNRYEEKSSITTDEYVGKLENSLKNMISSIKGVGECKVMVTIENGTQTIYATEAKKNTEDTEDSSDGNIKRKQKSDDSETKYITIRGPNGEEKALSITEVQPTIKGVVVVCAGGDDPSVQQRVTNAVITALNITNKRVCVIK